MKNIKHLVASIFSALVACAPLTVFAEDTHTFTLINHFDQPLNFTVTINPHVLPDFPKEFTLVTNEQITTKVLDIQKEAYIRAGDTNKHSAFFGVDIEHDKTHVHGYISKGIAYSWKTDVVTFCTPEEYEKRKSC